MDAEKIKEYHQKGIWVTANETLIHVADMETSHLVNVAKMLLRHAVQYVAITLENSIADGFAFVDLLQGEMAQETVLNTLTDFEQNFDEQEVFKEYLLEHPFWNAPFCLVEVNTRLATDNDTRVYEDPQEEILRFREVVKARQGTLVADDEPEELLDWDAHIETPPPPRQSGTIKVRFNYVGRSKPIPIDDTWT